MSRGPRLEFAVGAFLLLSLASLLVLAIASTNGKFTLGNAGTYELTARFTNIGQLRASAPVRIGGVNIGRVSDITLDPKKLDSVVTLAIDDRYKELSIDTSAGIQTAGLLGESYIGLQPGGDMEVLKPGEEIVFTTPSVDLMQMVGKYMFSSGGASSDAESEASAATEAAPAAEEPAATEELP
jgi:phospholipid/cholesterol/gamma-HCH transport system substrate-binding protein